MQGKNVIRALRYKWKVNVSPQHLGFFQIFNQLLKSQNKNIFFWHHNIPRNYFNLSWNLICPWRNNFWNFNAFSRFIRRWAMLGPHVVTSRLGDVDVWLLPFIYFHKPLVQTLPLIGIMVNTIICCCFDLILQSGWILSGSSLM